jgi:hypothetical protein
MPSQIRRHAPALPLSFLLVVLTACQRPPAAGRDSSVAPAETTVTRRGTVQVPAVYRFLHDLGIPPDSEAAIRARLPYDSISIRRVACFGTCPVYELTLFRDGRARYVGKKFVSRMGTYTGSLALRDYGRLCQLLDVLGFMALPDSFAARYTDLPTAVITAHRTPEGNKSVSDYGYVGPIELWAMQQLIDDAGEQISWTMTSP